jgi:MarR family transcriptional regulator, lower aerobic nicotinate degradation pathway regulator
MTGGTLIPTMAAEPQAPEAAQPALPQELLSSTVFLLKRLGDVARDRAVADYVTAGCSPYHHIVLALLAEGARETQSAIAHSLGLDRSQLVGILDELEERGLVERRRDANDRRRHTVSITADGRKALARHRAIIKRIDDAFLEGLDENDRVLLHDLLLRLAAQHDPRFAPVRTAAST